MKQLNLNAITSVFSAGFLLVGSISFASQSHPFKDFEWDSETAQQFAGFYLEKSRTDKDENNLEEKVKKLEKQEKEFQEKYKINPITSYITEELSEELLKSFSKESKKLNREKTQLQFALRHEDFNGRKKALERRLTELYANSDTMVEVFKSLCMTTASVFEPYHQTFTQVPLIRSLAGLKNKKLHFDFDTSTLPTNTSGNHPTLGWQTIDIKSEVEGKLSKITKKTSKKDAQKLADWLDEATDRYKEVKRKLTVVDDERSKLHGQIDDILETLKKKSKISPQKNAIILSQEGEIFSGIGLIQLDKKMFKIEVAEPETAELEAQSLFLTKIKKLDEVQAELQKEEGLLKPLYQLYRSVKEYFKKNGRAFS